MPWIKQNFRSAIWKIFYWGRHSCWHNRLRNLREICYKLQGMQMGEKTHLGKITATWPHTVALGDRCRIENGVIFQYHGPWKDSPALVFGNRVHISANTHFNIQKLIQVGDDVMIAAGCKFVDHDHGHSKADAPMSLQPVVKNPIIIEDNVWIGANSVILKGVHIGSGTIIGAGSVVCKNVPTGEIWGGVPAKFIKKNAAT